MTPLQRQLINRLQSGFPLCHRPFQAIAEEVGCDEQTVIDTLRDLLADKTLTRFGPMYQAEKLGGGLSLAAMAVEEQDIDRVAEQVNSFVEVAHNYQRDHHFNLWFVLATASEQDITTAIDAIEATTGYPVYNMPKEEEYYVGLRLPV